MKNGYGAKMLEKLQKFGPAMMLVIAIIPLGGLLLGIGVFMQNETFIADFPVLGSEAVLACSSLLRAVGNMIIGNLHILFAIAIAEGLSDHDGVAGFAAAVAFLALNTTIGSILALTANSIAGSTMYTTVLGIPTLQTGVFSGILTGLMVAYLYKKFKNVRFPQGLSFFQGKRFIPIASVLGAILLAIGLCIIWPPIQKGIISLGNTLGNTSDPFVLYVYGLINRLLIPFGLHNLWYPIFYFQIGTYTSLAGQVIVGDLNIYLAQLADGVQITSGLTSGGCYLFPGFCIAAALAITKMAKPENRKKTLGLFTAGIVTIVFTGITEPIEFVFLFTCLPLYITHSFFMALSFPILCILNIHVGSTFCGGLMDWMVYGVLQNSPGWQWIIPLNIFVGILYYFIFKFLIKKFNFKTPGREEDVTRNECELIKGDSLALAVLKELGGKDNIITLDACATRLRVHVVSAEKINKDVFKSMGASGVMEVGNSLQIIFGTQAAFLKEQVKAIIDGKTISKKDLETLAEVSGVSEDIVIPINGNLLELRDVPDTVFSEEMMGPGFAIEPKDGEVVSPVNGRVDHVFPTKHAIGIISDEGKEILIHMGMDTVKLDGKPFDVFVKKDDLVESGQILAKMNLDMVKELAPSIITPIVFTNMSNYTVELEQHGEVNKLDKNFIRFIEKGDI